METTALQIQVLSLLAFLDEVSLLRAASALHAALVCSRNRKIKVDIEFRNIVIIRMEG